MISHVFKCGFKINKQSEHVFKETYGKDNTAHYSQWYSKCSAEFSFLSWCMKFLSLQKYSSSNSNLRFVLFRAVLLNAGWKCLQIPHKIFFNPHCWPQKAERCHKSIREDRTLENQSTRPTSFSWAIVWCFATYSLLFSTMFWPGFDICHHALHTLKIHDNDILRRSFFMSIFKEKSFYQSSFLFKEWIIPREPSFILGEQSRVSGQRAWLAMGLFPL